MQTNEESDGKGEIPEDVPGPGEVPGQPGIDECKIPLVVFSTSEEGTDGTSGKTNDECSVDCESFIPADLLSFAWQIAGGMVSETGLQYKFGKNCEIVKSFGSKEKFFCENPKFSRISVRKT